MLPPSAAIENNPSVSFADSPLYTRGPSFLLRCAGIEEPLRHLLCKCHLPFQGRQAPAGGDLIRQPLRGGHLSRCGSVPPRLLYATGMSFTTAAHASRAQRGGPFSCCAARGFYTAFGGGTMWASCPTRGAAPSFRSAAGARCAVRVGSDPLIAPPANGTNQMGRTLTTGRGCGRLVP